MGWVVPTCAIHSEFRLDRRPPSCLHPRVQNSSTSNTIHHWNVRFSSTDDLPPRFRPQLLSTCSHFGILNLFVLSVWTVYARNRSEPSSLDRHLRQPSVQDSHGFWVSFGHTTPSPTATYYQPGLTTSNRTRNDSLVETTSETQLET